MEKITQVNNVFTLEEKEGRTYIITVPERWKAEQLAEFIEKLKEKPQVMIVKGNVSVHEIDRHG